MELLSHLSPSISPSLFPWNQSEGPMWPFQEFSPKVWRPDFSMICRNVSALSRISLRILMLTSLAFFSPPTQTRRRQTRKEQSMATMAVGHWEPWSCAELCQDCREPSTAWPLYCCSHNRAAPGASTPRSVCNQDTYPQTGRNCMSKHAQT